MKNTMTVDRKNRDALVAAINRYLDGRTTAFQFDDEIFDIDSDDPTVTHIVCELWYFYDDCKDHKVRLSKEEWDYIQRLILVLQSDGHVEITKRRRWDYTQLAAIAALLLFVYAAYLVGLGIQLLAVAIPFGLVSIAISYRRGRKQNNSQDKTRIALVPFSSLSEMIPLRRSASAFRKRKYPAGMKRFKIRGPLKETAMKIPFYAMSLFFAPLFLMFQSLPTTETETRIVMETVGGDSRRRK